MTGVVATPGTSAKPTAIVFDLDGVLYVDHQGVPGAAEALSDLTQRGYRTVFATNNSTKTPEAVCQDIAERTGFTVNRDAVVTSGMATARYLASEAPRCFVLGPPALDASLRAEGIDVTTDWRSAEAVVVGLDRDLSYRRLADAVLAVGAGARFVATNVDSTYPTPEGLYPGGGAIAAAVQEATGAAPEVCGKPYQPMRSLVRSLIGEGSAWVVGDRPETDLAMAQAEGWLRVLVLTGVTTRREVESVTDLADITIESVADLPAILP